MNLSIKASALWSSKGHVRTHGQAVGMWSGTQQWTAHTVREFCRPEKKSVKAV